MDLIVAAVLCALWRWRFARTGDVQALRRWHHASIRLRNLLTAEVASRPGRRGLLRARR